MKITYLVTDIKFGYSWSFDTIEDRDVFVKANPGNYRFETEEGGE